MAKKVIKHKNILSKHARACAYSKINRFKRGYTLVELTVAMSLSGVIVLGVCVLLATTNNSVNTVRSDSDKLYNAKALSLSIESNIDNNQKDIVFVAENLNISNDFKSEITNEDILNSSIIFATEINNQTHNYIFVNQVFGHYEIDENTSEISFTREYACTHKVNLQIQSDFELGKTVFTINYDEKSELNVKVIKYINA